LSASAQTVDSRAGLAAADSASHDILTKDGVPLKRSLGKALMREKFRALMLILPLLAFVIISFVFPIGDMLFRSVENSIVENTLPGAKPVDASSASTMKRPWMHWWH